MINKKVQFTKVGNSSVDLSKAKYQFATSSAENCAAVCINSTRLQNDKFACLSFDYCQTGQGFVCSLYDGSHVTDPTLVIQGSSQCTHYSSKYSIKSFN